MRTAARRLVRLVPGLALVGVLAPATPSHAAVPGVTLAGTRNGYVDLTLPVRSALPDRGVVIRTSGRYAGYYLSHRTNEDIGVGEFLVPELHREPASSAFPQTLRFGTVSGSLPAGRYRLHLITDGVSSIFIPLSGLGRSRKLTASVSASAVVELVTDRPAPGHVAFAERRTLVLPKRWVSMVAVAGRGGHVGASYFIACLVPDGEQCPGWGHSKAVYTEEEPGTVRGFITYAYSFDMQLHGRTQADAVLQAVNVSQDLLTTWILLLTL